MNEISELLKAKRLEMGMSVEEVSKKTRLSIAHIHALEAGNIKYFDNDLSYLRFYIKAYCEAVSLDYDEIKERIQESIFEYTTSFQIKKEDAIKRSESNIRQYAKSESQKTTGNTKIKKRATIKQNARKIDFSLVSFLATVGVLLICVLAVAGMYLIKNMNSEPDVSNDPPVVDADPNAGKEDDKPIQKDDEKEPVILDMTVTKVDQDRYRIDNAQEEITITIEFVPSSWFLATMDGVDLTKPVSKIYDAGSQLQLTMDPEENEELRLRFGYFAGMKIKVNDEYIEIDEAIANQPHTQNIYFEIGGKNHESAQ